MKTYLFFILALVTFDSYAQELLKPNLPDSVTIIQESSPFRKSPENTGDVIYRVKAKTKAELLGIENDHLKVKIDTTEGFISYAFIDLSPPGLKNYFDEYRINLRKRQEAEKDSIAKEIFRQEQLLKNADFQDKMARFTKKYGSETGKKIAFGYVWIGMTREELGDMTCTTLTEDSMKTVMHLL